MAPTYLGMNDGVLVILADVVVYEDVLNVLVKGVDPQRLPPTNGVGIADPPGRERRAKKDLEKGGWRDRSHKAHINGGLRGGLRTSQSGPESPPGPGLSWSTGTGLFLRHEWTLGLRLGSRRFPSCCSGSCLQSYSRLTERRATRGVRVRERAASVKWLCY